MSVGDTTKTITLPRDEWPEDSLGKKIPQKSLIQFMQGTVAFVQVGEDNPTLAVNTTDLGAIWALPSVGNIGLSKETAGIKEDDRFKYIPLLRGMQDIPDLGDPVLLCEFGGQKYYLGPLNSDNSPNNNIDRLRSNQVKTGEEPGNLQDSQNDSSMQQMSDLNRLGKRLNAKLDNPLFHTEELSKNAEGGEMGEYVTSDVFTQHGDMIFEGRHANSIRIGSRNINPYIFISNGRAISNTMESTLDGSVMAFIKHGSIRDHFKWDRKNDENMMYNKYPFTLADDQIGKVYRSISKTFTTSLGRGLGPHKDSGGKESGINDPEINKTIYSYNKNQVFLSSDRLMFNAREENIFMSSKQFIHLGAGNNVTISTSNTHLVEAATSMVVNTPLFKVNAPGKVYIDGRKNLNKEGVAVGSIFLGNPLLGDHLEPAVMGTGLVSFLTSLIVELKSVCYAVGEAIGSRDELSGPTKIMQERVKALNTLLGTVGIEDKDLQQSYEYPKGMADMILSNSVRIKK